MLYTFADITDYLLDFTGDDRNTRNARYARRAATAALQELSNLHEWSCYRGVTRVVTNASYNSGTVEYDHTGGAVERQLTLTGGTWPDWTAFGFVMLNSIPYEISNRISDTVLQLTTRTNPGSDVAATTYMLMREAYPLPCDLTSFKSVVSLRQRFELEYITPTEWMGLQRLTSNPAQVYGCTVTSDPNYQNTLAIRFVNAPSTIESYDIDYLRAPRPLTVERETAGTVSVVEGSASIDGDGTNFTDAHVGCVIRFYDASNAPTGAEGDYPAKLERIITAVSSTVSCTIDDVAPQDFAGVKYVISDPVDIDQNVMLNLYKIAADKHMARLTHRTDLAAVERQFDEALLPTVGADKKYTGTGNAIDTTYRSLTWRDLRRIV